MKAPRSLHLFGARARTCIRGPGDVGLYPSDEHCAEPGADVATPARWSDRPPVPASPASPGPARPTLPDALVRPEADTAVPHPVLAALVRAVVADLDYYARRGRLPRRPDLYGFRAYAALAAAARLGEDVLVDRITSSVGAVVRLWCAGADALAGEVAADANDPALSSPCGSAPVWARQGRGQPVC